MENAFREVFSVATAPDRWWSDVGWIFILPLAGILIAFLPERLRASPFYHGPTGIAAKVVGFGFSFLTGAIGIFAAIHYSQQRSSYAELERAGQLSFVEGCLDSFHAMPFEGHDTERISVAGQRFSYSDFDETSPAFNNTEAHGGPIHADSAVKIWYEGNRIIRLSVRDHACRPASDLY